MTFHDKPASGDYRTSRQLGEELGWWRCLEPRIPQRGVDLELTNLSEVILMVGGEPWKSPQDFHFQVGTVTWVDISHLISRLTGILGPRDSRNDLVVNDCLGEGYEKRKNDQRNYCLQEWVSRVRGNWRNSIFRTHNVNWVFNPSHVGDIVFKNSHMMATVPRWRECAWIQTFKITTTAFVHGAYCKQ